MKDNGFLVIHTNKDTGEFNKFEIYPKKFKEQASQRIAEWNASENNETMCKLYDDPLLVEMTNDLTSSWRREDLISSLRGIARDIEDSVDNLNSWSEVISSELADSKYKDALTDIREHLLTIIDCGKLLDNAEDVIEYCLNIIKESLNKDE